MRDEEEIQFRIQLGQATNLAHDYFLAAQNREPTDIEIQELIECKYLPMLRKLEQYFMENWRTQRIKRLQEAHALVEAEKAKQQPIPVETVFNGVQIDDVKTGSKMDKDKERRDEINLEL